MPRVAPGATGLPELSRHVGVVVLWRGRRRRGSTSRRVPVPSLARELTVARHCCTLRGRSRLSGGVHQCLRRCRSTTARGGCGPRPSPGWPARCSPAAPRRRPGRSFSLRCALRPDPSAVTHAHNQARNHETVTPGLNEALTGPALSGMPGGISAASSGHGLQSLAEDGVEVGVAAPLVQVIQRGAVDRRFRRDGRVVGVLARRKAAPAVPCGRYRRVRGECHAAGMPCGAPVHHDVALRMGGVAARRAGLGGASWAGPGCAVGCALATWTGRWPRSSTPRRRRGRVLVVVGSR